MLKIISTKWWIKYVIISCDERGNNSIIKTHYVSEKCLDLF